MDYSPELLTSDLCEEISRLIHTMLGAARNQRSDLLTEPCQNWLQSTPTEIQLAKITVMLSQQADVSSLLNAVESILNKLFIPAFKGSKIRENLLQRVKEIIIAKEIQYKTHFAKDANNVEDGQEYKVNSDSLNSDQAALLLVDAENINLPEELENFLQTISQYPIRYRLAFGNWRKLGERDQEFYQRGYQMVHVPSGKNSADIKMSLDASLISFRDPSIREVFICSTDSDLLHLGHTLLNLSVVPYRVSRRSNSFEILNLTNQTARIFHLAQDNKSDQENVASTTEQNSEAVNALENQALTEPIVVKVPTPEEMKRWLKILILQEQQVNPGQPITVSRLGKLFRDRNQISVNQALKSNPDHKKLIQFLKAHEVFELSPLPDGQHIEVTLKALVSESFNSLKGSKQKNITVESQHITNAHTLERALIKLLWSLSSQKSGSQIHLSTLGTRFAQVHKEPLSKVLERIGESKKLPKFLAKCRSLRLQKRGNAWWVMLACVS